MHHRSVAAGFRPGQLTGARPAELRAAALAPSSAPAGKDASLVPFLVVGAVAAAGAFFVGRWAARMWRGTQPRRVPSTAASSSYLAGTDALVL